ncbi:phosphoribosyltransferase family protein [Alkaliphilus sp. B6464]|uniref:phosphoribosyltransferase family protein n=1 Tax=Alkaliphilus sp. B6464 TaxID=2731219 RepID=UPI001BAA4CEF|nr:phosphoribosyltransferase family protein [Alkaliphilus sp. B6464]QUH21961.1 phosphoribosyltransferase domain-containing protein [Alkaliphilus sp. B6464]
MNKMELNIVSDLKIKLTIKENKFNIPLESLFSIASRINPKRSFLFVSKLLGKHLAIKPQIPLVTGALLSDIMLDEIDGISPFNRDLLVKSLSNEKYLSDAIDETYKYTIIPSKPTLFIGFAETATGLGHSMFSIFRDNAAFIHTTRDELKGLKSSFNFEEEHSHATSHLCYALEQDFFNKYKRIVLVDDEMTTGKTSLNLIRALNNKYPGKEYIVASILDWRNDEQINDYFEFEKELNIKISTISLLQGEIECNNSPVDYSRSCSYGMFINDPIKTETKGIYMPELQKHKFNRVLESGHIKYNEPYVKMTGRFGITAKENQTNIQTLKMLGSNIRLNREYDKTLVMGYGEFIYVPCLIASYMGEGIIFQSPSRSPIHVFNEKGYSIKNSIRVNDPFDLSVSTYIYNILPDMYDEVFMLFEREVPSEFKDVITNELQKVGIKSIKFICFK